MHGEGLGNPQPWLFKVWMGNLKGLAADLKDDGRMEVVNCTPGSALTHFKQRDLDAVLAEPG